MCPTKAGLKESFFKLPDQVIILRLKIFWCSPRWLANYGDPVSRKSE